MINKNNTKIVRNRKKIQNINDKKFYFLKQPEVYMVAGGVSCEGTAKGTYSPSGGGDVVGDLSCS